MSAAGVIGSGALRQLIRRYYGDECRIIDVRKSGARAFVFVCEATLRGRPLRTSSGGTIGRTARADGTFGDGSGPASSGWSFRTSA